MESNKTFVSDPGIAESILLLKHDLHKVYIVNVAIFAILIFFSVVLIYMLLAIKLCNCKKSGNIGYKKRRLIQYLWRPRHSWKKRRFNVNCIQETCRRDTLTHGTGEGLIFYLILSI